MPCYHPLDGFKVGKQIKFQPFGSCLKSNIKLPCGRCIGCRLEYSRQWAMRIMHEAKMHDENCFLTLTYDDRHLPEFGNLVPKHLTDFWKRLRKKVGRLRYYACGEYGDISQRPHYHACLFGWRPDDQLKLKKDLYMSPMLAEIWSHGLCSIGNLTFESAAYVARYVTKKVNGDRAKEHYQRVDPETGEVVQLLPEFSRMSRGSGKEEDAGTVFAGGIGAGFYDQFRDDMYKNDTVVIAGRGPIGKPPAYYDRLLEKEDPDLLAELKEKRQQKAKKNVNNSTSRLRAREAVAQARLKNKVRSI